MFGLPFFLLLFQVVGRLAGESHRFRVFEFFTVVADVAGNPGVNNPCFVSVLKGDVNWRASSAASVYDWPKVSARASAFSNVAWANVTVEKRGKRAIISRDSLII